METTAAPKLHERATARRRSTVLTMRATAILAALLALTMPAAAQPGPREAYAAWLEQDYETAAAIWRQLAETGDPDAAFMLAESHFGDDGDPAKALEWYRVAAGLGHVEAQFALGEHYAKTGETLWPGPEAQLVFLEAAHWLTLAAEAGHAPARHWLGRMALGGAGVPEDPEATRRWWTLAAAQGYRESYEALPLFGYEVPEATQDIWIKYDALMKTGNTPGQIFFPRFLRPLAEAGHMEAQFTLGMLYFTRPEQMGDPDEAARWLEAARLQGDPRAYHMLMQLERARAGTGPAR